MKGIGKIVFILTCVLSFTMVAAFSPSMSMAAKAEKKTKAEKADLDDKIGKPNARFDVNKMSDIKVDPLVKTFFS